MSDDLGFKREPMSCAPQMFCQTCGEVGSVGPYQWGAVQVWNEERENDVGR